MRTDCVFSCPTKKVFNQLSTEEKLQSILTMFPSGQQGVSMALNLIKSQTPLVCQNNLTLCHEIAFEIQTSQISHYITQKNASNRAQHIPHVRVVGAAN